MLWKHIFLHLIICSSFANFSIAQSIDSSRSFNLPAIEISDSEIRQTIGQMNEVEDLKILAGKKNEVIWIRNSDADLSINNARQIFSKVPGVNIWENDGSGIQTSISTRGLSPNRSWEFNVRQNGVDISSDVFGYPEAYFTPPSEAVERIEIIRGAASLQFGPQFGGLINYVVKKAPAGKSVSFETQQTLGAFGMFNTFTSLGLNKGKLSFYGYFHQRSATGWRQNSRYEIGAGYASLRWSPSKKSYSEIQFTRMNYESQQPGGLTDSLFNSNPQQSLRARNWMSTPWNVFQWESGYSWNEDTKLKLTVFALEAERNSIGILGSIANPDTINVNLNSYNPRQVDRDSYSTLGAELRFLNNWKLFKLNNTLAMGVRIYRSNTYRRALGTGSVGSDFDINLSQGTWGRSLFFQTHNQAVFIENIIRISSRFTLTPGIRFEQITSNSQGYIKPEASGWIDPEKRKRSQILSGIGLEFLTGKKSSVYANFSQNFRPVTFSELTPSATTDSIDQNLKDASGFNADFGYRGTIGEVLQFDVSAYYMHYDNRIGNILLNGNQFRTNIGTSYSKGLELFAETNLFKFFKKLNKIGALNVYASLSFIDARYTRWDDVSKLNDPLKTLVDRRVENAPNFIHRFGVNYAFKQFSISYQLNSVGSAYADALNTENPNASATNGKIPSYIVSDLSFSFRFMKNYTIRGGINNLTDERYFTRRAGGYPGPGILPGMGRSWFMSIGISL
jgi:Fe(3+) dicitrate transport protein